MATKKPNVSPEQLDLLCNQTCAGLTILETYVESGVDVPAHVKDQIKAAYDAYRKAQPPGAPDQED
jgi:hypothetical protein